MHTTLIRRALSMVLCVGLAMFMLPLAAGASSKRLPKGAVAIDEDTLAFRGGRVVLELGPAAFDDCPAYWVCLWENLDFGGRMLRFSQCDIDGDGQCDWQNLSPFGFSDEMSSWRNRKAVDAQWAYGSGGAGTRRCMDSFSSLAWVGVIDNDKASSVIVRSGDGTC